MASQSGLGKDSETHVVSALGSRRDYSVDIVSSGEGLWSLREDWIRLAEGEHCVNVFTSFEWAWSWWRCIGPDDAVLGPKQLLVLVLRRDGEVTGLAPFVIRTAARRRLAIRKVEFLGSTFSDYNDLLLAGDAPGQVAAICEYLAASHDQWDLIDLRSMRASSASPPLFAQSLGSTPLRYRVRPDDPCPFVPIRSDAADFLKTLSSGTRRGLRSRLNRLKRLEAEGLRIRLIENPQDEPDLLPRMIHLERGKQVRGVAAQQVLGPGEHFFSSLIHMLGPAGQIYVAVMEIADRLIAYDFGFRCGNSLWSYTKAHDPSYASYSPGTMLVPAVVEFGFKRGYREYDLLRGDERYKLRWTKEAHQTARIQVWKREWRSRMLACLYFRLRPRVYRSRWLSPLGFPYVPEGEV